MGHTCTVAAPCRPHPSAVPSSAVEPSPRRNRERPSSRIHGASVRRACPSLRSPSPDGVLVERSIMGSENLGAAMASGRTPVVTHHFPAGPLARRIAAAAARDHQAAAEPPPPAPAQPPARRSPRRGQRWLVALALLATAIAASAGLLDRTANAASDYYLMPRSELLGRPMSGTAWTGLKAVADQALPAPDLCNQDAQHHLRTFAAALVYARTGIASYGTKARAGVMAAIKTQRVGCGNAVLALGRQLDRVRRSRRIWPICRAPTTRPSVRGSARSGRRTSAATRSGTRSSGPTSAARTTGAPTPARRGSPPTSTSATASISRLRRG